MLLLLINIHVWGVPKGSARHCPPASPCHAWCCRRDERCALPRGVYNRMVTTLLSRSPPWQEGCGGSAGGHLVTSQPMAGPFRLAPRLLADKESSHAGMVSKSTRLDTLTEGIASAGEQPRGRCSWCFLSGTDLHLGCKLLQQRQDISSSPAIGATESVMSEERTCGQCAATCFLITSRIAPA